MAPRTHQFYAIAFVENLSLRALAPSFPTARVSPHELYIAVDDDGGLYIFPFGAVVMHDVPPARRDAELAKLHRARPGLTAQVIREDYSVLEDPSFATGIQDGTLHVDRFTPGRAGSSRSRWLRAPRWNTTSASSKRSSNAPTCWSNGWRKRAPFRTARAAHRFIGEAITTRTEVLSILHLLDKPDATWDDPAMDRIYDDLRAEFDLVDRYAALSPNCADPGGARTGPRCGPRSPIGDAGNRGGGVDPDRDPLRGRPVRLAQA